MTTAKPELYTTKFAQFVRTNAEKDPVPSTDLIELLIESFLLMDASRDQTAHALSRIQHDMVDFNDLRVSLVKEMVETIGVRYPEAHDRCVLMRRSLNDIFKRQHKVSLEHLTAIPKRDAKSYIESLDGISPFVAARVCLLGLNIHAVPMDRTSIRLLVESDILTAAGSAADISQLMLRHVRAEDAVSTHVAIRKAVDRYLVSGRPARVGRAARRPAAAGTKRISRK
ncbi:MAG: hypothetical protein K8R92_11100 [Planctomycetes bacterium]|nr:hypothetical protein [Planctomycetota bacterium]